MTGCGSAWLERLVWDQEVAGSNPVTPIKPIKYNSLCASGSVVEYRLAKARVAGSNPVSRFFNGWNCLDFSRGSGLLCFLKCCGRLQTLPDSIQTKIRLEVNTFYMANEGVAKLFSCTVPVYT